MVKKALILIPHQDDEIGTAGVIIKGLAEAEADVRICYATNGDYEFPARIRFQEAAAALRILGIPADKITVLGYPDTSNEDMRRHIFYYDGGTKIKSRAGHSQTYGVETFEDYAFLSEGRHHDYNRENYFKDVKSLILRLLPDLIVCTDLDHHVDHRMLSLVFDKAMGEVLKEKKGYCPVVLKAFAYGTNFSALDDYREINLESTKFPQTRLVKNEGRLDNPFYDWEKRVRVPSRSRWYGKTLEQSVFFEALSCHESQNAVVFAKRMINSDQVFWQRRSDNLLLFGEVRTSSGEAGGLNDFMLFDASEIHNVEEIKMSGLWKPAEKDEKKAVSVTLDKQYVLESISIWGIGTFVKIRLECAGKEITKTYTHMYGEVHLPIPELPPVQTMRISFEYDRNKEFGIGEIEVFEKKNIDIKYIKLLADGNMAERYVTRFHRPRLGLYQYCTNNLKSADEIVYRINGKEVSGRLRIPWNLFLRNRRIRIQAYVKNAPDIRDEMEIIR